MNSHMLFYAKHLDLPRHRGGYFFVARWHDLCSLVYLGLLALIPGVLLGYAAYEYGGKDFALSYPVMSAIVPISLCYGFVRLRRSFVGKTFIGILGIVGGVIAFGLSFFLDPSKAALSDKALFVGAGALAGIGVGVLIALTELAVLIASAVHTLVMWLPCLVARGVFYLAFPGWRGIVKLGEKGIESIYTSNRAVYVSTPENRNNGKAADVGATTYTYRDRFMGGAGSSAAFVSSGAGAAFVGTGIASVGHAASAGSHSPMPDYGDHSGLSGGFDINPANGLPMVGGMGGVDVGGNAYGTDYNNQF